jgi:ABC-type transport system substrate-binding protein
VEIRVASNRVARAAVVADMWRRAGVDSSIAPTSGAQQQDRQFRQSAPGVQITSSGYEDAGFAKYDGNEQPTARTGYAGANLGHYDNPRTTELIERFRLTLNEPERGQLVKQVADLVAQDLPLLPFFHNPQYVTVSRGAHALDDIDGARALITGGYAREAHLWDKD